MSMKTRKTFLTNCVSANGDDINAMVEVSIPISRKTFCKHTNPECRASLEKELGYAVGPSEGLHMKDDWHVDYQKSEYMGKQCVYLVWSSIEYIFT